MDIRKTMMIKETIEADGVGKACDPIVRVAAVAVIQNPFAGRFVDDLSPLFDVSGQLGEQLMGDAVDMLAGSPVSYGKAAIVGEAGEREHAAAVMHPRLGKPVREVIGPSSAIIPSATKMGGPGTTIDCPLHYKDDAWRFSHFDAMEVGLPDAPRADEILVCVAVTDSGRPFPRVGGLTVDEIKGEDGLR